MAKQVVAIVALGILLASCHGGERAALPANDASVPTVGVRVQKPKSQIAQDLVRVTGKIQAKHEAVLGAPATGTLAKIYVSLGDRVQSGQALARLDTWQLEIGLEQARAAHAMGEAGLAAATTELERAKQLRQTDAAPAAMLDRANAAFRQASAGLDQAKAAVHAAQATLEHATLRAPFDGVVTQIFKNVGETVAMMPPTPVVTIVDAAHLEVRVPVPETIVDFIDVGTMAKGTVSPSGKSFAAKVYSVGAVVDPMTRTVEVAAEVQGDVLREMRPGSLAELDFSESLVSDGVVGLYLPAQAIRRSGEQVSVLVVSGEMLEERIVKTESVTPGIVRVKDGLSGEEDVVIEGASSLNPGTRVRAAHQS
ncbi:MAG: efflux RND transporter periplasmic adaptor subunit [Myxococcota bacterium]